MSSRAAKKRAARPSSIPKKETAIPDHVDETDVLRLRLVMERVTRLRAEQRAIGAELIAAQAEARRAQAVIAAKYHLAKGDEIEPNGLIIRSNGQAGTPKPATPQPAPPQE